MAITVSLLLALTIALLVTAYFKFLYRKLRPGEPPIAPGHWFWGNCIQFKEHAVRCLHKAHAACGDVFTVRFLNQHITMVLDVHSYERFAKEKNFDFDAIQKQVNNNVFGYELVDARKMISEAGQKVNGRHLFTSMENFAENLTDAFLDTRKSAEETVDEKTSFSSSKINNYKNDKVEKQNAINANHTQSSKHGDSDSSVVESIPRDIIPYSSKTTNVVWREDDLRNFASRTFFSPVFYSIFGRGVKGQEKNFHPQVFHKMFDQFHKYFNFLWLGMPVNLFPEAINAASILAQQPTSEEMMARDGCSEYIKFATDFMLKHSQSERDIVCHNLVFLHVNYNTFRVVYWCIYKLMEDAKVMAAVRQEIDEVVEAKRCQDDVAEFTAEDINKLSVVDSFLKEIIRCMSGVFMIRKCLEDTAFTTDSGSTYNIRKGDRIAIYPPAFHHDPEIFEEPETFKYDRFIDATFFKNGKKVKNPLIAFGSLCPGQKLSMLQIKWFIINLVNSFKLELLEGETTEPNINMYGHEILPPTHDVRCRFTPRESPVTLTYVNTFGSAGSRRESNRT